MENKDELISGISSVGPGGSIFINAAKLELTQTLHVNTSNFTLRGRGINATMLNCAMTGSKNAAFSIKYDLLELL